MDRVPSRLGFVADRLELRRDTLAGAALVAIRAEHPLVLAGMSDSIATTALDQTTGLLIDTLVASDGVGERIRRHGGVFGRLGAERGVPMEQVSGATRVYQREAWATVETIVRDLDPPAGLIMELAISSLDFADRYSRATLESYVAANAGRDADLARARQSLLNTLLGGVSDPEPLTSRIEACGWRLPSRGRVAIATGPDVRWPPSALVGQWDGRDVAILAEETPAGDAWAAGPEVEIPTLPISLKAAIRIAALPAIDTPARWEDHLLELLLSSDPLAGSAFVSDRLGPLDFAPERQQPWLLSTLEAWLDCQGSPTRMAQTLHLHPQSVRYRLTQLRELLGSDLDDPDRRFDLKVALTLRRLLPSTGS